MDFIVSFVKEKTRDGKLALADVCEFLRTRFRIPVRTFQWYVEEGYLPSPLDENTKAKYYSADVAEEVLEKARLIKELKEYSVVKFSTIKDIFDNYKERKTKLIDFLSTIIEEFPAFERGMDPLEPVFSWENAEIIKRACQRLQKGEQLENIKMSEIEREIAG
jgi:DNA-binding transcriptional MerR regulator